MAGKINTVKRIIEILKYEKQEIIAIYFYAVLNGLVTLSLPLGIQAIISFVVGGAFSTSLVLLIIFVVGGVFVNGLLQVNQMKIIEKIQQQLFVRYAFRYAHFIPHLNLKETDGYYLPELVNRFFDTVSLQKGISKILLDIPVATIQILFGLLLLSFYHSVFIFFGILLIAVLYLILRFTGNRGIETSMEESNYKYKVAGHLEELARVVTSFKFSRNNALHLKKTDEYVTGYLESRTSHFKILMFQYWALISFKILITASMLIVGSILLVNQQINIGQFIAAEIVIITVIGSVEKLIINLDKVYDAITSLEKLNKLTDKPAEKEGTAEFRDLSRGLSLHVKNLSFGYTEHKQVLKNLNFDIESGDKVCIMGPYCSGKSTLLRVLSGAYQPFQGTINFNGISITNYTLSSIRQQTGMLINMQDIFHGTLWENITMGNESVSLERITRLAAIVGLTEFIESNPEGLQLQLYPTGMHLSGRIIKKILLLRALVTKPNLLLLEEPWLELEAPYAENIKNYLLDETNGATVLVISNDTSFAAKCSKTLVLESGTVKAFGNSKEILN